MNKRVEAEVRRTQARPLTVLPAAWWDTDAVERMGSWIERNVPVEDRLTFTYGRRND